MSSIPVSTKCHATHNDGSITSSISRRDPAGSTFGTALCAKETPRFCATSASARSKVASCAWWRIATSSTQQSGSFNPVPARSSASRNGSPSSYGATTTPAASRSSRIATPRPTRTPPTRTSAIVMVCTTILPGVPASKISVALEWCASFGFKCAMSTLASMTITSASPPAIRPDSPHRKLLRSAPHWPAPLTYGPHSACGRPRQSRWHPLRPDE